jgi:hypothetical protein
VKAKKITGIVLLIIGIIVIIYAINAMHRIANAKGTVNTLSSPISGNPVGDTAGNIMKGEVSQYDTPVMWLLIGGIVIGVVGAAMTFCCCRKKSR